MKCLSIWDPWATLIMLGAKRYETRSWRPPRDLLGERIAIHASKNQEGLRLMATSPALASAVWTAFHAAEHNDADPFRPGCIIATAILAHSIPTHGASALEVSSTEKQFGDWTDGRFAWLLADIHTGFAIPCRGRQGLFDVPTDLLPMLET